MAFIIIDTESDTYTVAIDKKKASEIIGIHRHTLTAELKKKGKRFIRNGLDIIEADRYYPPNTTSGNRTPLHKREWLHKDR